MRWRITCLHCGLTWLSDVLPESCSGCDYLALMVEDVLGVVGEEEA